MIHDCIVRPKRVPHFDFVRWQIETLSRHVARDDRVVQAKREVVLADVGRTERGRAQVALTEVALDQDGLIEADFGRLAVVHVTAAHVRII